MVKALQDYIHDTPSVKKSQTKGVRKVRGFQVDFIYLFWRGPKKKKKAAKNSGSAVAPAKVRNELPKNGLPKLEEF